MKFNASIDVAIIISLITVFLFANGQAYLGGLLTPFGIDPIVLNFSVQDKIYIDFLKGYQHLQYFIYGYVVFFIGNYFLTVLKKEGIFTLIIKNDS